jgi:DNA polymerase III epsilon subunit-like protein
MSPADAQKRISELRAEVARHAERYYRQARPEITDFEYDCLKRELADLETQFAENANSTQTSTNESSRAMNSSNWLLIDTETTGLRKPIYCVEIAAQMMKGFETVGDPFQVLLNHDVPIDPTAEAIHGYTREYLRKNGKNPNSAYEAFRSYAQELQMVSYNLSFDWGRVLEPEYSRLNIAPIGQPAFCALTLARRCIYEADNHRLETLRNLFFPDAIGLAHRAAEDVRTTVRLLREVIWPRLESAGISKLDDIAQFSRETPIALCVARIRQQTPVATKAELPRIRPLDPLSELRGLLLGILADDQLVDAELWTLRSWLDANPQLISDPVQELRAIVSTSIADGVVTVQELGSLKASLAKIVGVRK